MRRPISRWSACSKRPTPALASSAETSLRSWATASGAVEPGFELGESRFQSCQALSELAQVISAVLRCSGSGRGPRRGCAMRSSLGGLQDGGKLRVRGCEQAGDLLGEGLVRRHARKLALPEVEITAG